MIINPCAGYYSSMLLALAALAGCFCSSMPVHFNTSAEKEDKNSPDIISFLAIKTGSSIADLGAGGGYFSVKLASAAGTGGIVYAVDIDPASLAFIKSYAAEKDAENIKTVQASFENSGLENNSIDLIFMRNAYHDFSDRTAYFSRLRSVFKQGGRIAIIDYERSKLGFFRKLFGHSIDEKTIIKEMEQAGYKKIASHNFLKEHSFNIFSPE
jgi:ubiquinone/menaquinone biosynthesis C-methylase UbiE